MSSLSCAIRTEKLSKRYRGRSVVDGLDLTIPQGEAFGLLGPNGAGKTTFIKMLLGVVAPTSGRITLLGSTPDDPKTRAKIGYLPERLVLPSAHTPLRFLHAIGNLKGLPKAQAELEAPRLLQRVGLAELEWTRRVGRFSKGMKQRVGLAAALMGSPELLVLDEPTDGLDPMGRVRIREVIEAELERGATVFLNSHLLAETERICARVAIIGQGRLLREGRVDALRLDTGYRVRFAPREDLSELATKHGFSAVAPNGRQNGRTPPKNGALAATPPDSGVPFAFLSSDAALLSKALSDALLDGLVVLEVSPSRSDLEAVMREVTAE